MRKIGSAPELLLATPDEDIGLVPAKKARKRAKQAANELKTKVTVRNPLTDKVVATEMPDDLSIPPALDRTKGRSKAEIDAERIELISRDKRRDEAQRRLLSKTHTQQETTMQTHTHTETTKRQASKAKVLKAKALKQAKKTNGNGKTAKVVHRTDGPTGATALVLKLASRPNGASRKELIEATGWGQQAWKWGFENKHNTGWAQRHGYRLSVIERKDGTTAYKVSKK